MTDPPNTMLVQVLIHYKNQDFPRAIEEAEAAAKLYPNSETIYSLLADLYSQICDFKVSIHYYKKAIEINPTNPQLYHLLGKSYFQNKEINPAISSYKKALAIDPNLAEVLNSLGNAYRENEYHKISIECFRKAVSLRVGFYEAMNNLANVLKAIGELDEAIEIFKEAILIKPSSATLHKNIATAFYEKNEIVNALSYLKDALTIEPAYADAELSKAFCELKMFNFSEGWNSYEARWKTQGFDYLKTEKKEWYLGLSGKLFIWSEQGIGDEIMFASILEELLQKVENVVLQCDPRLIPIFRRSFDTKVSYIAKDSTYDNLSFDYILPIGSLPKYFRMNVSDFSRRKPAYLKAEEEISIKHQTACMQNSKTTLLGISWNSTAKVTSATKRNLKLNDIIEILPLNSVQIVSLQYGDHDAEISAAEEKFDIRIERIHEIDKFNNIDGLLSCIQACDEIITIDNVTVHLAGALGKQVYALLPFCCDWRWGLNEKESLWYEHVSLFRQTSLGVWDDPLKKLQSRLLENLAL